MYLETDNRRPFHYFAALVRLPKPHGLCLRHGFKQSYPAQGEAKSTIRAGICMAVSETTPFPPASVVQTDGYPFTPRPRTQTLNTGSNTSGTRQTEVGEPKSLQTDFDRLLRGARALGLEGQAKILDFSLPPPVSLPYHCLGLPTFTGLPRLGYPLYQASAHLDSVQLPLKHLPLSVPVDPTLFQRLCFVFSLVCHAWRLSSAFMLWEECSRISMLNYPMFDSNPLGWEASVSLRSSAPDSLILIYYDNDRTTELLLTTWVHFAFHFALCLAAQWYHPGCTYTLPLCQHAFLVLHSTPPCPSWHGLSTTTPTSRLALWVTKYFTRVGCCWEFIIQTSIPRFH